MNEYFVFSIFSVAIICIVICMKLLRDAYEDELTLLRSDFLAERAMWQKERQQLLDRIQAPSFDHLKAAEVRVIKAQKEEPQERIELL